jgi:hypothetical protein
MSESPLITFEQLKDATKCKTKASLEKILRAQKVPFLYGDNGTVFTTRDAVNAAMGLLPMQQEAKEIEFRR